MADDAFWSEALRDAETADAADPLRGARGASGCRWG
jgi:hypothetical protein